MCWKCEEIDKGVPHYRAIGARLTDKQTLEGIQQLIAALEAEKRRFIPSRSKNKSLKFSAKAKRPRAAPSKAGSLR
jgi:hypothetical protein